MSTETTAATPGELAGEITTWAVGGGIITLVLFPLALPSILLNAAGAIPFLLVPLGAGLVIAVFAAPILLLRRLLQAVRISHRSDRGGAGAAVPTRPATSGR